MNNKSKILVLTGALALGVSGNASAAVAAACSGTAGAGTAVSDLTQYITSSFTPRCSKGTAVHYNMDTKKIAVRSGSSKGMHTFGGTSEGGGIVQCEPESLADPVAAAATVSLSGGCPAAAAPAP